MNPLLDLHAQPVIAHRGGRLVGPENTIEAFRLGLENGADALELDVRSTADGVAVVIHDATLDRTTDRSGPVAMWTREGLAEVDAGFRFSPDGGRSFPHRGKGVRIPTLEEVLLAFRGLPLLVHVKVPQAQAPTLEVLTRLRAAPHTAVASERRDRVRAFSVPPFVRGATRGDSVTFYARVLGGKGVPPPPYGFFALPERVMGVRMPTRRFVAAARAVGCPTHVWTVNDADAARRLWDIGVCGIVTDSPAEIREVRDAR